VGKLRKISESIYLVSKKMNKFSINPSQKVFHKISLEESTIFDLISSLKDVQKNLELNDSLQTLLDVLEDKVSLEEESSENSF
jgi:hypothetical protein